MRSSSEVRHKYNQLVGRHLERIFQKNLSQKPSNCVYNHIQEDLVPNRNRLEIETTGFCMYNSEDPVKWEGKICETLADARGCPYFTPKRTKQDLYNEYMGVLMNPEVLQHEYRDLYILQWVMDNPRYSTPSLLQRIKNWVILHRGHNQERDLPTKPSQMGKDSIEDLSNKLFSPD